MRYIRRFSDLGIKDIPLVGGKNASLGEMYSALSDQGVNIPNGFATTAEAYQHFIEHNQLESRIRNALDNLDTRDTRALAETGARIRSWIVHSKLPDDFVAEILQAYHELEDEYGENTDVAVRSSATAEDLPGASFAGQQETYLNIRGDQYLLTTCRQVFASLFTDRAISYRVDKGFTHMDVALSVGVQKMVRSDLGASGVMFTIDTETGFEDVVFITAAYGLGENIVQGTVNPDEFYVFKPKLDKGFRPIIKRQLGEKEIKMIYSHDPMAGLSTYNVAVKESNRKQFSISDDEVLELARQAVVIEKHYQRPMDIEWARDGTTQKLFIVQARPETVRANDNLSIAETYRIKTRGHILTQGKSVGQKIAAGKARVIYEASEMHELKPGEVLVTDITDPDWEPVMKTAAAIVTNRGGRTCHAAIIAREMGIPAVVGCNTATQDMHSGEMVTVSCAEGDDGFVYEGEQEYEQERIDLSTLEKPQTHIMLNLANPAMAFEASRLPTEGVGLARLEFIINNSIRIHPRALLEYDTLDESLKQKIAPIIGGYKTPRDFYIQRLAEGVSSIAAAFYPRKVIVRMSDFKSNEYASLIGGQRFEPKEENPMIGFRGASRYFSNEFAESFALECMAMKYVREEMGLDNLALMIPFVRSVEEAHGVLRIMSDNGLKRSTDGLQIYMMCEIPANALLADDFLELFDGFSIGSNDLTQLTLGVDRDSGIVTSFDERNPAVLKLLEMAIEACNREEKYVGICGQAPSDYPEITQWLVEHNIDSISLNPDSVLTMTQTVLDIEKKQKRN